MPSDIMLEILEDGTVSIKTSDISMTHHLSADEMLDELEDMLGGSSHIVKRTDGHAHAHTHGHNHHHIKAGR